MISFLSAAGMKNTCWKLILPIGLLAVCNSNSMAYSNEKLIPLTKLIDRFALITGTVTDEKGLPLPGVSVYEKQSKKTTLTNSDGKFSIEVADGATLVFLMSGMITRNSQFQEINL